jgi:hypothetical protein
MVETSFSINRRIKENIIGQSYCIRGYGNGK